MEIYQLRAFTTVAKLGSITRASEALHVTQPAVTAQLKGLEEELGISLFDRRPGKIVLTRAGEALLGDVDQLLALVGNLTSKAKELKGQVTGTLVIGTVGDPDSLRLGSLLSTLVQALPLLEIKTRQGHSEELRELVTTGAIQSSFYIGPNLPRDVLGVPLQTLYYRIAGPFEYKDRLLNGGWQEISEMPWIGAPSLHHSQTLLKEMFARQGLSPHVVVEADDASFSLSLVRSGVGLALIREDIALIASEQSEVVIWPHVRLDARLCFIYSRPYEHDPATIATLSQIRAVWSLTDSLSPHT
jgi:DNA-binding transcriptional LysR family regulator